MEKKKSDLAEKKSVKKNKKIKNNDKIILHIIYRENNMDVQIQDKHTKISSVLEFVCGEHSINHNKFKLIKANGNDLILNNSLEQNKVKNFNLKITFFFFLNFFFFYIIFKGV